MSNPPEQEMPNAIYEMLFCDNLKPYSNLNAGSSTPPWSILTDDHASLEQLSSIAEDHKAESRIRLLAFHRMKEAGVLPKRKELLGVIVEIGMEEGLDTLAAYQDGTARYLNHSGRIIIWETRTEESDELISTLFKASENIVSQIGPWDKPRRSAPTTGNVRLSFLVSDGLYFGEGPVDVLFSEPMAAPALKTATDLLQYLTSGGSR